MKRALALGAFFVLLITACGRSAACESADSGTPQRETIEYEAQGKLPEETEISETKPIEPEAVEEAEATSYLERGWLAVPYLVELLPYRGGAYTDGMNIFTFAEDGSVYVHMYRGSEFALNVPKPPQPQEYNIENVSSLGLIAAYNLDMGWWNAESLDYIEHLLHVENDRYFFHFTSPGGGSGEAFWSRDMTRFASVCIDGHFVDLGVGAEHIVWHDNHFYFLDMVEPHIYWTPGIGTIGRMDMDGSNRITILDSLIVGPLQILNNRIFFSCLENGLAYNVDLLGNDRQSISERVVPRYHRVWLELYDRTIISRAWMSAGYGMGIIVAPSNMSNPAIMCVYGGCLVTFPHELRGDDPFEVIAYGYDESAHSHNISYFMVFRSNIDDSLWVYHRHCTHGVEGLGAYLIFGSAREQLEMYHSSN